MTLFWQWITCDDLVWLDAKDLSCVKTLVVLNQRGKHIADRSLDRGWTVVRQEEGDVVVRAGLRLNLYKPSCSLPVRRTSLVTRSFTRKTEVNFKKYTIIKSNLTSTNEIFNNMRHTKEFIQTENAWRWRRANAWSANMRDRKTFSVTHVNLPVTMIFRS